MWIGPRQDLTPAARCMGALLAIQQPLPGCCNCNRAWLQLQRRGVRRWEGGVGGALCDVLARPEGALQIAVRTRPSAPRA